MVQSSAKLNVAVVVMLALSVGVVIANENGFFGVLAASLGFAVALNGLVGAGVGFVVGAVKWSTSGDVSERAAMFGAKVGVYVFAILMLISLVLAHFKQPPTRAPVVAVAVPWYAFEIAGCILEPISWFWEIGELTRDTRNRHRNRRNPNDRR